MEKSFASIFENVRRDNYNSYNEYYQSNEKANTKAAFLGILNNYLRTIIKEKINIENLDDNISKIGKKMIERLTGNYEIGVGDIAFSELIRTFRNNK